VQDPGSKVPSADAAGYRWKRVEWSERVVDLLLRPEYRRLLTLDERVALQRIAYVR